MDLVLRGTEFQSGNYDRGESSPGAAYGSGPKETAFHGSGDKEVHQNTRNVLI